MKNKIKFYVWGVLATFSIFKMFKIERGAKKNVKTAEQS
tara:strand:- start:723 stop:839 length:117 start_codon:yes stop_codon:yes gene_type:complete